MHAQVIRDMVGRPIGFVPDVCGPFAQKKIDELHKGDIIILDNVRFMAEEMTLFETKLNLTFEQQAQTLVVRKLAPLADLYVCDAFAAAHRSQPTLVGFEQVLPSAMGRLFEKEYTIISDIIKSPKRPCAFVLGGAKIEDAFLMMDKVLREGTADAVLTGGLVANVVAVAKDIDIGKASEDFIYKKNLGDCIERAREILYAYSDKIIVPQDFAYVEDEVRHEVSVGDIPQDKLLIDIGQNTIDRYVKIIREAGTNGTLFDHLVYYTGWSFYHHRDIFCFIWSGRRGRLLAGQTPFGCPAVSAKATATEAPCQPVSINTLLLSSLSEILAPTHDGLRGELDGLRRCDSRFFAIKACVLLPSPSVLQFLAPVLTPFCVFRRASGILDTFL
jgi:hypothetical protein